MEQRLAALAQAGDLFRSATIGGLTVEEYQLVVSRATGLAITTVRAATEKVARYCTAAYDYAQFARPTAAVDHWRDPSAKNGTALWVRRGRIFGVHAAGNHPAIHADWIAALALGYRVAVRPSRREPFTPYRLVSALRMAGFGDDQVVFLPGEYEAADEMIRGADRSMVYGGDAIVEKYASQAVLPQGPGRSKILIGADVDWREHLDLIVDSASRGGGTGCTNTTAVFVEGDPLPLATALAERLAALPSLPPEAEEAVLPVQPVEAARAFERHLLDVARGTTPLLGGDGIVDELGDGSAAVRPAVFVVKSPDAAQVRAEMPFPCVWVAGWTTEAGIQPFKDTLVLTVLVSNERLVEQLIDEPSIRNVYGGAHPTYWNAPNVPHDGYLADFLMESKGFIAGMV
ncbi:aldehyde dehydrogenase family protein [Nonomuraea cypriaca]|uniref:aldehyde dehydrogenase family protein n=1 Tax=Nonomuraea cypriaca TaxID=1187855 RepID=UPI002E2B9E68|nr:aldehyde dehydrogenase family protein [Nonomuraea cypriaca]